jgi:Arc/MetJ-type ribon-helix-helix transcriptional regulator
MRKKQKNLIHVRLSDPMLRMMNEIITKDLHVTISEFIRDAIIEYTKLNYPTTFEKYKGEVRRK